MNLPWLLPPPQKGVKHLDLRVPQPPARLHLARRPSALVPCLTTLSTLTPELGTLPAAELPPSAPPGPRAKGRRGLERERPAPEGREERGADPPCCPPRPAGSRPGSWRRRASCGAVCTCWSHRLQRERATVGRAGRPDHRGGPWTPLHVGQAGTGLDSPGTEPRSPPPPPCHPQAERSAAPQLVP